ncbi:MAG: transglutaminase-like domain-containing protein [Thermodesulfobacteriota bacterium]
MVGPEDITRSMRELAEKPDHEIRLAPAALKIAAFEYPHLDEDAYIQRLEDLGARARISTSDHSDPSRIVGRINRILFEEEGFRGNSGNYYDPQNSCLNRVLDRKLGIPITLSIVYIEIGRANGLPLYGVGFPGHFITGMLTDTGRMFIDPFYGGRILTEESCRLMLKHTGMEFSPRFLDPIWPKQILARLIRNLKGIYWSLDMPLKALQTIEWILILDPYSAVDFRDQGLINEQLGDGYTALMSFEKYLKLAPDAEDHEDILARVSRLKSSRVTIH